VSTADLLAARAGAPLRRAVDPVLEAMQTEYVLGRLDADAHFVSVLPI
jgi:hypothetical protein